MPIAMESVIEANPARVEEAALQTEPREPEFGHSVLLSILAKHCRSVAEADARKKRS